MRLVVGVIFIIESYVVWNLLNKVELLETWVEDFSDRVAGTWEEIKTIDSTGHFESDDEIGSIFTSIKQTIEELNQYIEEDTNAKES